jgi:drug/metabolite transporter (DMT)-like permease
MDEVHDTRLFAIAGLVLETVLSGASSVYMQQIFDHDLQTMWSRNVQMAVLSVVYYGAASVLTSCEEWYLATAADVSIAFLGGIGGLLVALSLTYAGAVEKTIATTVSMILTILIECAVEGDAPGMTQLMTSGCVVVAVALYAIS